jgi:3-oxoacyl-[acyl-carrier protein] reductase
MSASSEKRTVIITGASGGLGKTLVAEFARAGWNVVAASRSASSRAEFENVLSLSMDVTARDQIDAAISQALERFGRIDALINNAGAIADGTCGQLSDEDWQRVLDANLRGAFLCSQAVARQMIRQRDGHIINISSYGGRAGAYGQSNYAAAKAGLLGLTQSLARELGSRNVRVNAVLPGVLPTHMTAKLSPDQLDAFARANVLGRINALDEVARFIQFLVTSQNISGQIFQLDSRIAPWT